jgi:membrane-associated phospholipid phosphatase
VKAFSRNNAFLFIPYLLFLLAGAVLIFINSKSDTHLEFNRFHNSFFDLFFLYATWLGDGVMAAITVIFLLAVRYRYALFVAAANIVSALFTQVLKHTIFSDVVRPKKYFEGIHDIYLVPHVENYLYNSFPSGHSTCAFALYFCCGMIVENKYLKFTCFLLALIAGYSRIYLSQHFFEDVYAGSLIGVCTAVAAWFLIMRSNRAWLDRSLISIRKTM